MGLGYLLWKSFPPLIFGILFSALMKGLPVERNMQMNAGFSDIVNLYTITGGVTLTMLCLWHGLIFATIRTMDDIRDRSRKVAMKLLPVNALSLLIFSGMTFFETDLFSNHSRLMLYTFFIGIFVYLLAGFFLTRKKRRMGICYVWLNFNFINFLYICRIVSNRFG